MTEPTRHDDDADLVACLRERRPEAARRLYDAYGVPLHAFVRRLTGDPELAQEIVQDVMTRVWHAAPRFDAQRGPFRAWVYEIARNAVVDQGRRSRRRPQLVLLPDDGPRPRAPEAAAADDELERLMRSWLIATALDRLPADHRAVIDLVYFRQLRVAEAAAELGIPEGTVKSRCFYALQHLRAAFHEVGVIRGDL